MRSAAAVKLFVIIAICTIYFISFSQIGALAYETFFADTDRLPAGTMVGPISLAGKSKQEALQVVEEKVNEWKANASIAVVYQEKKDVIPASLFTFQPEQSVAQMVSGRSAPLLVLVDMQACSAIIQKLLPSPLDSAINLKKLENDLIDIAARLQTQSKLDLAAYIPVDGDAQQAVSSAVIKTSNKELLEWVAANPMIEIKGKQIFSLASYMKEAGKSLSSEAMSIMASAIYETILPTNFTIVERHTSRELPDGIKIGYEAKVDDRRDLQFYNPNTTAYTLSFQKGEAGLRVTLVGLPFAYQYVARVGNAEYFEPRTVVQYSPLLRPGERQLKQSGKRGMLVKVTRETYDGQHHRVRVETIAEDFYPPSYNIELRGLEVGDVPSDTNENSSSTEQPANHEEQADNNQNSEQADEKQNDQQSPSTDGQSENGLTPSTNVSGGQKNHDHEK
ncbi:hypothetical protein H839_13724 [Parageobacillus genomosp. 1]|uniref:G5 domain-containing protein n=1 Tax=Parageobacillus genomosp. 1 TaxID=1295642 RepID=A0ABC9VDH1_9BACL|nr:VanW family protein [Parageobacillus genomosp. 1]EZP76340.1 hypothetical protein H839_13724 [Parageobacillus genomosp. 1]